ncbi:uncharacterized protein [Eurosta solidaginis]|uniref:uncharacterized protein n=1 Tax=Eurosta solidaginis TaxID=178769 RepID=UPI003530FFBC
METQRHLKFCTGSQYLGTYNGPLNCMEGYGTYTFPDGSEYHGYFLRGRFHGFGRLTLASPYSFTFVGKFENGEMVAVNKMVYSDGLVFHGDFDSGELKTDDWSYLSKSNRLYTRELCMGLLPVAPHEPFATYNERPLAPNTYDTVEGIYHEQSNFITKVPEPFNPQRHVACKEVEWIRNNCRCAEQTSPVEPAEEHGRAIIENNIKVATELQENVHTCSCNLSKHFRFGQTRSERTSAEDSTDYCREAPSSSSSSSFSDLSLEVDLERLCDNFRGDPDEGSSSKSNPITPPTLYESPDYLNDFDIGTVNNEFLGSEEVNEIIRQGHKNCPVIFPRDCRGGASCQIERKWSMTG